MEKRTKNALGLEMFGVGRMREEKNGRTPEIIFWYPPIFFCRICLKSFDKKGFGVNLGGKTLL